MQVVLNEENKNRLAELIAHRQATLTGAGSSAPAGPLAVAQDSPSPPDKNKGVVAINSKDEDTEEGLVFKRPRVGVATTSLSATDDRPLSLALEGSGESAPGGDQVPTAPELPAILQHALKCYQEKEAAKALDGDLLSDCMGQSLREFLVNSLAFVSQAKARMKGELALQAQIFANHETALTQELSSLRQSKKETKKLLFDKGQETLQLEAKILPLHNSPRASKSIIHL